ncbi:MAG: 2-phosphosulfolactate phosphatase, partial [Cyanobacteria bacterium J06638_6]
MTFNQSEFDVRCEWGQQGVLQLAPINDVVIIVDVLSFSTCVDIATGRGAIAFPYQWRDGSAQTFAQSMHAELATKRGTGQYSLSPASLLSIPQGTRLVLPSPNGSTLSLATGKTPTIAGCLRNAKAVASAAMSYGQKIAVIPAGERWSDGSLRPALEDLIGAGAVLSYL